MKRAALGAIAGAWLFLASPARGNDATFGGAGADLVPLDQNDVEMKSEDIVLEAVGVRWKVRARYVFSNHASSSVSLQVGFPEYRCDSDEASDCGKTAFRDLSTRVAGVPVQHRSGTLDKKHRWAPYLGTVWLFDVTFPSGKDVVIEHEYSLDAGENVMGDVYTTYVTRTGAGWRGAIGSARFTALLPPYAHTVKQPVVAGLAVRDPVLVQEPRAHVKLVLEAKDWTPQGEVSISFNDDARYVDARSVAASAEWQQPVVPYGVLFRQELCLDPKDLTPEDAQSCRNVVYASKGFPFKKSELVARYYSGSPRFRLVKTDGMGSFWVRNPSALSSFSESSFNRLDRQVLRDLERIAPAGSAAPTPSLAPPAEIGSTGVPAPVPLPAPSSSASPAPQVDQKSEPSGGRTSSRCSCRTASAPDEAAVALAPLFVVAWHLAARRRRRSPAHARVSRPAP